MLLLTMTRGALRSGTRIGPDGKTLLGAGEREERKKTNTSGRIRGAGCSLHKARRRNQRGTDDKRRRRRNRLALRYVYRRVVVAAHRLVRYESKRKREREAKEEYAKIVYVPRTVDSSLHEEKRCTIVEALQNDDGVRDCALAAKAEYDLYSSYNTRTPRII